MFNKMLLPLDLTDRHEPVLQTAAEIAGRSDGEVVLLHVIEYIDGWDDAEATAFYDRIEESAKEHLSQCGRELDVKKVSWRSEIRTGPRAATIVEYAGEIGADCIVLSSPRIDPNNPTHGWASLSWKIGVLSSVPVLLLKPTETT